ncbi:DUF3108 domain-containing protein [Pelomonas cellulosilytica]|uniref:DUF3108 domain-containing protein n=1 Tax=Pelomonas cellulosilytica TaxID=2906762 RepID=A0ABS8XXT7_9BURK|nr:DUF3108 domain-containing protein [Pelomonas sp. P8]MCE4557469.1 DUF3108 domain-containing protein [Pelomonas sp. P8]
MRARLLPPRAAWFALAASLAVHSLLLGGDRERRDAPRPPRAVTLALPIAPATPRPAPQAEAAPPAPPSRSRPPQDKPAAPAAETPAAAAAEAPPLRLAGPASWPYRLRQDGQDGDALLDWQPQPDGRYTLRLTRRIGERALPALESLGRTGGGGLAPERFALQRGGRDRQAINFDSEGRRVSFSASPAQLPLPDGAQDRLSWWLQLAALVQAAPAPGGRWRLWVAGVRGELREWVFKAVDGDPVDAGALHLRRQSLGEHDPGIDVWLDTSRGYWPVRLRYGDPETKGYEITLADVNS